MASQSTTANPPLALMVPRTEAHDKIVEQIAKGQQFLQFSHRSESALEDAKGKKEQWSDYTIHLMKSLFNTDEMANEFATAGGYGPLVFGPGIKHDFHEYFIKDSRKKLDKLESILLRLGLIPEPANADLQEASGAPLPANRKVFIVHGHDEAAKLAVARYLEAIDFEPIVLHEQANKGDTIIEKIERHADVGFAVVLLTPDDVGGKDKDNLQPRARQNVVAELGYFIGKLGRGRVLPLKKGTVEIPTDFSGVVYTDMDDKGYWKIELGNELEAAGFEVEHRKMTRA